MVVHAAGYTVALLHAPKTGGTSRAAAIANVRHVVLERGHDLRASQVKDMPRIAVVREPVDRFLSAWVAAGRPLSTLDMALAQPVALLQEVRFRPQVHWYDTDDIEHLIAFEHWPRHFDLLMRYYNIPIGPIEVRNQGGPKPYIKPYQALHIQDIYYKDESLWLESTA